MFYISSVVQYFVHWCSPFLTLNEWCAVCMTTVETRSYFIPENMVCNFLLFCTFMYFVCMATCISFLTWSFDGFLLGNKFCCRFGRHVTSYTTLLTRQLLSVPCRIFELGYTLWSNFWRSVCVSVRRFSNVESESECVIESDDNTECVAAKWQNKMFPCCMFSFKQIFWSFLNDHIRI